MTCLDPVPDCSIDGVFFTRRLPDSALAIRNLDNTETIAKLLFHGETKVHVARSRSCKDVNQIHQNKGALWTRRGLDQTGVACIIRDFMFSFFFLHVDILFSHIFHIYLLFLQIVSVFLFTKASCQAWLKLLIANEVRIGGLGGGVPKPDHLRQFTNHLGWLPWSVFRPMYQVAIG